MSQSHLSAVWMVVFLCLSLPAAIRADCGDEAKGMVDTLAELFRIADLEYVVMNNADTAVGYALAVDETKPAELDRLLLMKTKACRMTHELQTMKNHLDFIKINCDGDDAWKDFAQKSAKLFNDKVSAGLSAAANIIPIMGGTVSAILGVYNALSSYATGMDDLTTDAKAKVAMQKLYEPLYAWAKTHQRIGHTCDFYESVYQKYASKSKHSPALWAKLASVAYTGKDVAVSPGARLDSFFEKASKQFLDSSTSWLAGVLANSGLAWTTTADEIQWDTQRGMSAAQKSLFYPMARELTVFKDKTFQLKFDSCSADTKDALAAYFKQARDAFLANLASLQNDKSGGLLSTMMTNVRVMAKVRESMCGTVVPAAAAAQVQPAAAPDPSVLAPAS